MVRVLIDEIREYGIKNDIPIMSIDSIETIKKLINDNNIATILEIGTAIGYSTINFASCKSVNKITSIERDENRFNIAKENVLKSKLNNIELILGDALNT